MTGAHAEAGRGGEGRHVALLLPSLAGGGAEASMLTLARGLIARGLQVDIVLCARTGPLVDRVPPEARVIDLAPAPMLVARATALAADPAAFGVLLRPVLLPWKPPHRLPHLPALVRYLRRVRPAVLLATMPTANLMAVWARRLAGVPMWILVNEQNTLSAVVRGSRKWRQHYLPPLVGRVYRDADARVTVSDGVADDLAVHTGLPRARITTVHNPLVTPEVALKAGEPIDHPWLQGGAPPVLLGVGALAPQKDFPTLLRAFARVRAERGCRLMILGQARNPKETDAKRAELLELATRLGVADEVALPGFVANPFAYMARAAVFVLSSVHEGLPSVLVQALACGCPAVSTDCPSGPAEILDGGQYGPLVPMGDDEAMAAAILATLDHPIAAERLKQRADLFDAEKVVDRYRELMFASP